MTSFVKPRGRLDTPRSGPPRAQRTRHDYGLVQIPVRSAPLAGTCLRSGPRARLRYSKLGNLPLYGLRTGSDLRLWPSASHPKPPPAHVWSRRHPLALGGLCGPRAEGGVTGGARLRPRPSYRACGAGLAGGGSRLLGRKPHARTCPSRHSFAGPGSGRLRQGPLPRRARQVHEVPRRGPPPHLQEGEGVRGLLHRQGQGLPQVGSSLPARQVGARLP